MNFKTVNLYASGLFFALFLLLALGPQVLFLLLDVPDGETARFLARRAGVLFLGLGLLAQLTKGTSDSEVIRSISLSFAVAFLGLIILGLFEYWRGFVNFMIFGPIAVELTFAFLYLTIARKEKLSS